MGAANVHVAIEACTNLAQPNWAAVTHLTCGGDGQVQFTDPAAANQPSRYYRFRPEMIIRLIQTKPNPALC
jgi:hypothetical protein